MTWVALDYFCKKREAPKHPRKKKKEAVLLGSFLLPNPLKSVGLFVAPVLLRTHSVQSACPRLFLARTEEHRLESASRANVRRSLEFRTTVQKTCFLMIAWEINTKPRYGFSHSFKVVQDIHPPLPIFVLLLFFTSPINKGIAHMVFRISHPQSRRGAELVSVCAGWADRSFHSSIQSLGYSNISLPNEWMGQEKRQRINPREGKKACLMVEFEWVGQEKSPNFCVCHQKGLPKV